MTVFAVACASAPDQAAAPRKATPVVIVTDCGVDVDDQWAIAHAVLAPTLDVRAVLTTHATELGEQSAQTTAVCVRKLFAKMHERVSRPPVITGANVALTDKKAPVASFAVAALRALAKSYDAANPLHVVLIAPATDVASALLMEPSLAQRLVVHAMAFESWPVAGDAWDARNDIAAWQALLASNVPVSIGSGDTSKQALVMTRDEAVRTVGGTPLGDYLVATLDGWLATHGDLAMKVAKRADAWPVWDEIAIADVMAFSRTEERPRPVLLEDMGLAPQQPGETVRWVVDVDHTQLWQNLSDVTSAEADAR